MKRNVIFVVITTIVLATTMIFASCEKKEESIVNIESKMSLAEFIASVESEEEVDFFQNHKIVDNTIICKKSLEDISMLKTAEAGIKIKFKWAGGGCVDVIGVCVIIPIGKLNETEANANAAIMNGKYILMPETEDDGLTSDGYLPIFEDLFVDENTTIKAGIYTANYDEKQGKYTAVALDLK